MVEVSLLPAQFELLADVETPILGFVAGLGSGKTHGMVHKHVQGAIDNPGCASMYVAPTYPLIRDAIVPEFLKVLDTLGIPFTHQRSMPPNIVIRLPDGDHEIRIRSATNPETIGSASNLSHLTIDEVDICDPETVKRARTRVRDPRARRKQIVMGGTPEGQLLLYDMFVKNPPLNEETGEPLTRLIRAVTDDNVHLDPMYFSTAFAGMSEEEAAQFRRGEFILPRGRVYHQLKERHIRKCENPTSGSLVMLCDFNVSPMTFVFGRIVSDELHIFDELVRENTDTIEHTLEAVEKWRRLLSTDALFGMSSREAAARVTVYADASGGNRNTASSKTDLEHLRSAGFRVFTPSQNPPIKDRVFSVNQRFHLDKLFIDPKAEQTRKCFENQTWDAHGYPDKSKGLDHATDAVGYGVHYEWPAEFPRGNTTNWMTEY